MNTLRPNLALAIVLASGMASISLAQGTANNNTNSAARSGMDANPDNRRATFRACGTILDRDVSNSGKQKLGEVKEVLIDRGSGDIEYIIVQAGATMGMGGTLVALPMSAFRWDAATDTLVAEANEQDLRRYPRWNEKDWMNSSSTARSNDKVGGRNITGENSGKTPTPPPSSPSTSDATRSASKDARTGSDPLNPNIPGHAGDPDSSTPAVDFGEYYSRRQRGSMYSDPYGSTLDVSQTQRIEGEIQSIETVRMGGQPHTVASITSKDGKTHRVALGPSWYISGAASAPKRGDKVTLDAVPVLVASKLTVDNQEMTLRSKEGSAWNRNSYESSGQSYGEPYYRHVRLSKLKGAKLDCRGTSCGKVDDVILDLNNGRVAFLSIDPNQNFLGIADEKKLVPWSIVSVALNDTVRVDTDKSMMLSSPKTPSDLNTMTNASSWDGVYKAYQVNPPSDHMRYNDDREAWREDRNSTSPSKDRPNPR